MSDDAFLAFFRTVTGSEPALWMNPDGTPSQWFVHAGKFYERQP